MLERCRAAGGWFERKPASQAAAGSQRPSNQDLANSAIQTVAGGFPHVSGALLNDMGYVGSPTCSWCMSCTELILYFFPGSSFLNFQSFFNFCYLYHINWLFFYISVAWIVFLVQLEFTWPCGSRYFCFVLCGPFLDFPDFFYVFNLQVNIFNILQ